MFKGNVCSFYGSVFICGRKAESKNVPDLVLANDANRMEGDKELLDLYRHSRNDDSLDVNLLMTILHKVHSSRKKGKSIWQTGCMEGSPSLKVDSSSTRQEIPHILWNLNVHSYVHKSAPLVGVLCQMNSVPSYFCMICFNIIFHSRLRSLEWRLTFKLLYHTPVCNCLSSHMHDHVITCDIIIW